MHFCSGAGRYTASLIGAYFLTSGQVYWAFYTASGMALAIGALLAIMALLVGDNPILPANSGSSSAVLTTDKKKSTTRASGEVHVTDVQAAKFVRSLALFVFLIMGTQNSFQYLLPTYVVAASNSASGNSSDALPHISPGFNT